jgi:hypothetical protein
MASTRKRHQAGRAALLIAAQARRRLPVSSSARWICAAIFLALTIIASPVAKADIKQDFLVCNATPDSPAKQECMKKLQEPYKRKAFSVKACTVTFWLQDFLAIDDYLKIHDADYDKALKMLGVMNEAESVFERNGSGYSAYYSEAGYYNSAGSEWKPWAKSCVELARFVALHPQQ